MANYSEQDMQSKRPKKKKIKKFKDFYDEEFNSDDHWELSQRKKKLGKKRRKKTDSYDSFEAGRE